MVAIQSRRPGESGVAPQRRYPEYERVAVLSPPCPAQARKLLPPVYFLFPINTLALIALSDRLGPVLGAVTMQVCARPRNRAGLMRSRRVVHACSHQALAHVAVEEPWSECVWASTCLCLPAQ